MDDSVIEVWQANVHGRYAHAEDTREVPLVEGFDGFGRAIADSRRPFHHRHREAGLRPRTRRQTCRRRTSPYPLFARGLLKHLVTRIYFSDEAAANENDPVLLSIEDAGRRATLVAVRQDGGAAPPVYEFDIHLQGPRETVFFDV